MRCRPSCRSRLPARNPPTSRSTGCRGLVGAIVNRDVGRLNALLAAGCDPSGNPAGARALEVAISQGHVEATRRLLEAGVDPNALGSQGMAMARWLGSGQRFTDDDLLEVARLLDEHGCKFETKGPRASVDLITNLAPRGLPKTLAFLASKHVAGDYTRALGAVAKRDDVDSVDVLLRAGADPTAGVASSSALMDAALAGKVASVAAMLRHVRDKDDPKVLAAYRAAVQAGHADTARAFLEAGVRVPPAAVPPRPLCPRRDLTPDQAQLLARLGLPNTNGLVALAGAMTCKLVEQCGTIILVDCNVAADGPAYYIDQAEPRLLATCGRACMGGQCRNCPPQGWSCGCRL